MSKLTDIKNRIDQMDGGAFQNLCDAYLSYKGYKNVYSLGMRTGTDKTAKGNPDTYFLTAENKYVFVMYTTQKTDFLKKAIEDIDKCFDSQKTGVSAEDIVAVSYTHLLVVRAVILDCSACISVSQLAALLAFSTASFAIGHSLSGCR